jgi:hypothetical protein
MIPSNKRSKGSITTMLILTFLLAIGDLKAVAAEDRSDSSMDFNQNFNDKKVSINQPCLDKVCVELNYSLNGANIVLYFF